MTVLEGIKNDISILNTIQTPAGVPVRDFTDQIGLPVMQVINDLESIARFMEESQRIMEEQKAKEERQAAENAEAAETEAKEEAGDWQETAKEEPAEE